MLKAVEIDVQPISVCSPGFLSDLCQTILLSWTLFQSSTNWQLVFPLLVPCCFSIWVCHASTQEACFQSALTFYIYVYLKPPFFFLGNCCASTRSWIEPSARLGFHNSFASYQVLVPLLQAPLPRGRPGYVNELPGWWSLAWVIADYTSWCSSGAGSTTKAAFHPLFIH